MTIYDALTEGSASLALAGIKSSGLDASLLLAEVLNISRSSLLAAASRPLAEESFAAFIGLIKRRLAGECVAYIVGRKEFYGLEFLVNPSTLVPRPDTEILVEAALIELGMRNEELGIKILDLCTGSGAIAIVLKREMPELDVWAVDISAEALETAQTNAARLLSQGGGGGRPSMAGIHFCHGDLFDALPLSPHSLFSVIVSNPPYVPTAVIATLSSEVRMEPFLALDGGDDGLAIIRRIISCASDFLRPGGTLLLEADPQQMERIDSLLKQAGFSGIQTYRDLSGAERVIKGKMVKQ